MRQDTLFLFHNFEYFEVNKKLDNMGRNKRLKLEKSFVGEIIKKQAENIPSCEDITKLKVTFHNKNKPKVLNKKVAKNSQLEILEKSVKDSKRFKHRSSISLALPQINSFTKLGRSLNKRISNINSKSFKDFMKTQPEEGDLGKCRFKRKFKWFGSGKYSQKLPSFYDLRLIAKTPDRKCSRDFFQFLGKSKEELEEEKSNRLENFRKRKHDADTAIFSFLSHKIERFGKKVLISSKGVKG